MKFRVYAQRLTTYEVECASEDEARGIVRDLEERARVADPVGAGVEIVDQALSVSL